MIEPIQPPDDMPEKLRLLATQHFNAIRDINKRATALQQLYGSVQVDGSIPSSNVPSDVPAQARLHWQRSIDALAFIRGLTRRIGQERKQSVPGSQKGRGGYTMTPAPSDASTNERHMVQAITNAVMRADAELTYYESQPPPARFLRIGRVLV